MYRVIFFILNTRQSHLQIFRVKSELLLGQSRKSHDLVESLRVYGLQDRVNVESYEISHFFLLHLYAMKWHPIPYKMATDKLENGGQHAIKRHPIGEKLVPNVVSTSLNAGYLYLSFLSLHFTCPFHSQSFQNV